MRVRLLVGLLVAASAWAQSYADLGDERLAAYIEQALERNPALQASFARYRAGLQKAPQMGAMPDPMLTVTQYARSPETRVGPQTTMIGVQQRVPWFGKRADQANLADKEAEALQARYEADQAEVVRQVKTAYYELAYLGRAHEITEEDLDLLRHFETLAESRYGQGLAPQAAVIKLQAEITRQLNRLEILARQRTDAEASMNALLARPADEPIETAALQTPPQIAADAEELFAEACARRPELDAAFHMIESDEKRVQISRRSRMPDLMLGAGFVNVNGRGDPAGLMSPPPDNGKNIYNVSLGLNLPIFRRKYDAAELEAAERLIASKESYRDGVNRIGASVRSIAFRLETLHRQIELFETTLTPQAEQSLSASEAAYSTGTGIVLDLLDSQRTLLEIRLGLARHYADTWISFAEMERAVGAAFPEVQP